MKTVTKKAELGGLQAFVIGIGGVAVVLVVALIVVGQLQTVADNPSKYCGTGYTANASEAVTSSTYCLNTSTGGGPVGVTRTAEYTAAGTMATKLGTIPTWVGIVIVVALAFMVLGYFYGRERAFW